MHLDIPIVPLDVTDKPETIIPVFKSSKAKYLLFGTCFLLMCLCLTMGVSLITRPVPPKPKIGTLIDKYLSNEPCPHCYSNTVCDPCVYMVIELGSRNDEKCYLKSLYDVSFYDRFVPNEPYHYIFDQQGKCSYYEDDYNKLYASYLKLYQIGSGFLVAIPVLFVLTLLIYICCVTPYEDFRKTTFVEYTNSVFNPASQVI